MYYGFVNRFVQPPNNIGKSLKIKAANINRIMFSDILDGTRI